MKFFMQILPFLMAIIVGGATNEVSTKVGRQYGKSLAECNSYMLDNQLGTDVRFQVGPKTGIQSIIRAHKYVLISRSAVFESLLYGRNINQTSNDHDTDITNHETIIIEDMDPEVFRDMLTFVYADNVTININRVLPLMHAARKYQLPNLIKECQRVLQRNISVENAAHFFELATYFNEPELFNKSIEFIGMNAAKVAESDGFLQMSGENLLKMVSCDWLPISESTLYKVCIKWAEAQLKKNHVDSPTEHAIREQLGEVFQEIRFPTMSLEQFANLTAKSDMLSCAEKTSIYYYIATQDRLSGVLSFEWNKRKFEKIVNRFQTVVQGNWDCVYESDSIQFRTDKDIILTAVGSYLSANDGAFNLAIDIHENSLARYSSQGSRIGGMTSVAINSTLLDDSDIARVPLPEGLKIKAGADYTITFRPLNRNRYGCYGKSGKTNNPNDGVKTEHATFWFSGAGHYYTTASTGQIPRLYYVIA